MWRPWPGFSPRIAARARGDAPKIRGRAGAGRAGGGAGTVGAGGLSKGNERVMFRLSTERESGPPRARTQVHAEDKALLRGRCPDADTAGGDDPDFRRRDDGIQVR